MNNNEKINRFLELKKQRNAVVLAHYYQESQIQDLADYLGDSLYLAQVAQNVDCDVILFCGVHFMAETAKILNPDKIVLIPDLGAGCSLADSAPPDKFQKWVEEHPDHIIVSYINCSAEVKAMSDIICTSSNAEKIINSIPKEQKIGFAPDKYLGSYVAKKTGRDLLLWDGSCQVHIFFSEQELIKLSKEHPEAKILAHPECPEHLLDYADYIGSTSGIIKHAEKSDAKEFIILTEPGIISYMEKHIPDKKFYPVANLEGCSCNICPYMKLNTLDKMISALEKLEPQINIPEEIRIKALKPLQKMLELSK